MSRKNRDLSSEESHARKLITAEQMFKNIQIQKSAQVAGIPARFKAGAVDPDDPKQQRILSEDYRYWRVVEPESNAGRRQIEFLRHLGYEPATDGEFIPALNRDVPHQYFRCNPVQYAEATRAMKMIASNELNRAGQNARHRMQEEARHKFGSGDITAEIQSRQLRPHEIPG